MPALRIKLDGVSELQKQLGRLHDANRKEAEKILLRAGRVVRDEIRNRAPVKTGGLKKSIKITRDSRNRSSSIFGVWVGPTRPGGSHAGPVEFGSKGPRKIKGIRYVRIGGNWRRITTTGVMRAKPFIRPGFDASQERFVEEVKRELNLAMGAAL